MKTLATLFLAARLYAHRAHNLVSDESFFADHDFLGGLYEAYDSAYDAVIERMIGLGQEVQFFSISKEAQAAFDRIGREDKDCEAFFRRLLSIESGIRRQIETENKGASLGTQNLLQDMADQSEMRTYKLKQRAKKEKE